MSDNKLRDTSLYTYDGEKVSIWEPPKYNCPVHGETDFVLTFLDIEGAWCIRCIIDKLEELGLERIERSNSKG
jgi:hypothetical protein